MSINDDTFHRRELWDAQPPAEYLCPITRATRPASCCCESPGKFNPWDKRGIAPRIL
jgi:hypothetical protein